MASPFFLFLASLFLLHSFVTSDDVQPDNSTQTAVYAHDQIHNVTLNSANELYPTNSSAPRTPQNAPDSGERRHRHFSATERDGTVDKALLPLTERTSSSNNRTNDTNIFVESDPQQEPVSKSITNDDIPSTQAKSNQNPSSETSNKHGNGDAAGDAAKALREARLEKVSTLMRIQDDLHQRLLTARLERSDASETLHESIGRRNYVQAETEQIKQLRMRAEYRLSRVLAALPRYEETLEILGRELTTGHQDMERMLNQKYWLVHEKRRLIQALRQRGLEHWVERSVKDSVSPFVSDALVQGTASVVEPVLDGIERLASVESDFSRKMSMKLGQRVPIVQKPFYAGFVTYTVLLCPTVLVVSLVLKVKRGFDKLTLGHAIILGNFYFFLLSAGCFVATMLGSVDVLHTFRHHNMQLFDFAMFVHGLLYLLHICLQLVTVIRSGTRGPVVHISLLLGIGSHFFVHSYRHAMHQEDPHVEKRAYLVYTGIFLYMLYEQTVKRIRDSQDMKVMTLNNTSITCPVHDIEAGRTSPEGTGRPWFPADRASFLNRKVPFTATFRSTPEQGATQDDAKASLWALRSATKTSNTNGSGSIAVSMRATEETAVREL